MKLRNLTLYFLIGVVSTVIWVQPGFAQQDEQLAGSEPVVLVVPDGARSGPDFDVEQATDAYVNLLTDEQRAKSNAYMEGGYWLILWNFIYGLAIAWLLLAKRLSIRMRDLSERLVRWRALQSAIYAALYVVLTTILVFPLTVYQGFLREHAYDLATQTFGAWMGDQFTGLIVGIIMGIVAITGIYAVIRKAPNTWWIWGSVASVAFLFLLIMISPVFIAPLFNEYKPLEDGPLRDRIVEIARANQIPANDVYWFDASAQTTRISANVSGFAGTMRISLNDNLMNRTSQEEVEAVMGHEMGHYVLNHGVKLITNFGLLLVAGFAFVFWGFDRALRRWGSNWGIRGVGDTAGLPLFAALLSIFFFFATPIVYGIIRVHEIEADNYGLNVSRQPDGFARVAMRVAEYRKISPGYWEEIIFYHHPSGRNRVNMAMQWKSENQDTEPDHN